MKKTQKLVFAALFAGLITLMTAYVCHIPVGVNGGYIHLGDTLIYLAASILPAPYAILAAGIGGGLADLLTAPVWMPATIIIKILISLAFTSKRDNIICGQNIIALFVGGVITVLGYAVAEGLLFDSWFVSAIGIIGNIIQAVVSGVLYVVIGLVFDKSRIKKKLIENK